jgi:flagellar FliL protein
MAKDADSGEDGDKKGLLDGKLKLVVIFLPTLLLIIGGLYVFVFSGGSEDKDPSTGSEHVAAAEHTEEPGEVIMVEPVTINLAGGHFLKVGVALQATADAGEEVPPSKATDAMISLFSGKTMDELATAKGRDAAKKELLNMVKESYEKKVYEIYFTSFVMN